MTAAHIDRAHASLAPSAAHRWINCPGSIRLSKGIKDKPSSFANEGTAAHELIAHCLSTGFNPDKFEGRLVFLGARQANLKVGQLGEPDGMTKFLIDEDMIEATQVMIDHVRPFLRRRNKGEDIEVEVEQKLDMTHIHPELWGTGDAVIYDAAETTLEVTDYKHGVGVVVEPERNPQLFTYALGACKRYGNRPISKVRLTVIQPRAPHRFGPVRSWEAMADEVLDFEDLLAEAAARTNDEDAPVVAGNWCRFCPALPTCDVARKHASDKAKTEFMGEDPSGLSDEDLADVLRHSTEIRDWVKAVETYAHARAMEGHPPTGFKLVATRATRKWKNPDVIAESLEAEGLDEKTIYKPREVRSPAQMEKAVGKKAFEQFSDLVEKKSSGTKLAPLDDPAPAIEKVDAAEAFA